MPREDAQREHKELKFRRKNEKSANFWASTLPGPQFFWVWAPPPSGHHRLPSPDRPPLDNHALLLLFLLFGLLLLLFFMFVLLPLLLFLFLLLLFMLLLLLFAGCLLAVAAAYGAPFAALCAAVAAFCCYFFVLSLVLALVLRFSFSSIHFLWENFFIFSIHFHFCEKLFFIFPISLHFSESCF